jgi:hypothetical protein
MKKNVIYGCVTALAILLVALAGFAKSQTTTASINSLAANQHNCCVPCAYCECETPRGVYVGYKHAWCE